MSRPWLALLALVYSDAVTPTSSDVLEWFSGASVRDYIRRVSAGCTTITNVPFIVSIPEVEHDSGGSCRTQPEQWATLSVPAVPGSAPMSLPS